MVEISLSIGEKVDMLETTMLIQSVTSMLKWCFLIVLVRKMTTYIRKENANPHDRKHSQKNHRKGR